ncbi:MAG: ATP-binding protein [Acidobacteriota bacterium]|nr:ATP-binding protein [Acidobacteriota bacterium]
MEDFRRQFLIEMAAALENLHRNLEAAETLSAASRREIFRTLHTVKGTAQTFGFPAAARLAHELETRLADGENSAITLLEGIEILRRNLVESEFQTSEMFSEISLINSKHQRNSDETNKFSAEIPAAVYSQLSDQEKRITNAALRTGEKLFVLEIAFESVNFADHLMAFREQAEAAGEIIAVFPGAAIIEGKITFQFLIAGSEKIVFVAEENSANVAWSFERAKPSNGIGEVLRQITRHGEETAVKLGKQIVFETTGDEINFSAAELKLIFEILLHLVRNAVDHAIERVGKIEILIKEESGGVRLSVVDDGRGIDAERIKVRAIEKNLISDDENLSETDLINLIFQPEFSTGDESNEISGRGIGLDAARAAAEKLGGVLSVVSEQNKGARFEVFLPRNEDFPT